MAFPHWTTIATGTGQLHLVRGALPAEARLGEDGANLLRRGWGVHGLDTLRDTHREHPSRMQRLPQRRLIDPEVPRS